MPNVALNALTDIALATSASGTILKSQGPGQIPTATADVSPLTVQPAGATAPLSLAVLGGYSKNCQNFGAVGDGTANDTAACQAALDAAGVDGAIYFPAGEYKITSPLTVLSGQHIYGEGMAKTKLRVSSQIVRLFQLSECERVVIRDMKVDGNDLVVSGACVQLADSTDCFLDNVHLTGGDWGVLTFRTPRLNLTNCIIESNAGNAVEIEDSDDCIITGCAIESAGANAIELYQLSTSPMRGLRILGNWLKSTKPSGGSGVACFGVIESTIADNTIADCTAYGIYMTFGEVNTDVISHGVTITGNAVRGCAESGIYVNAGYGFTVANNVTTGNARSGIVLNHCESCSVSGNASWSNAQAGISIGGGEKHAVIGNTCFDNPLHGINGSSLSDSVFIGNTCTNKVGTTQPFGLLLSLASDCDVHGNILSGNATGGASITGTGNRVYLNIGNASDVLAFDDPISILKGTGTAPVTGAAIEIGNSGLGASVDSSANAILVGGKTAGVIGVAGSAISGYIWNVSTNISGSRNSRWVTKNDGTSRYEVLSDNFGAVLRTPLRIDHATGTVTFGSGTVYAQSADAAIPNGGIAWSTNDVGKLKCRTPAGVLKVIAFEP